MVERWDGVHGLLDFCLGLTGFFCASLCFAAWNDGHMLRHSEDGVCVGACVSSSPPSHSDDDATPTCADAEESNASIGAAPFECVCVCGLVSRRDDHALWAESLVDRVGLKALVNAMNE